MKKKNTLLIDLTKKYIFPRKISIVNHSGFILVIADDTAKWIVLNNIEQLDFFNLLKINSIADSLSKFNGSENDAKNVITQIEAKHFENTKVKKYNGGNRMHIYLTNACNLRCPHCYMFAGNKLENELETIEVYNLLNNFKKSGGQAITLSGGEVCTRLDLYDIVSYAKGLGLNIQILTNGTMWGNEQITKISPLIHEVQISIDGYSEVENSKIRGTGNFEKALLALDAFVKNNVKTEVAITPIYNSMLESKIERYIDFGKSLLEKYADKDFKIKFSGSLFDGRNIKLSDEDREKYKQIAEKIYVACYNIDRDSLFVNARRNDEILDNCAYGELVVNANGDIYLCAQIQFLKPIGNIRTNDWNEIIKLAKKGHCFSDINNLKPCNCCELKYICGGGCRLLNFKNLINADLNQPQIEFVATKECSIDYKKSIYDMMIRTNSRIFQ